MAIQDAIAKSAQTARPSASRAPVDSKARYRFRNLDGLRGIAAVLVLIGHAAEQYNQLYPIGWLDRCLDYIGLGRIGVIAFFVLSGFVIPFSFERGKSAIGFAIKRIFRLYPAFLISLALMTALLATIGNAPSISDLLANATMAPALFGKSAVIGIYWTLLIEMIFYVICIMLFITGLLNKPWTAILLSFIFGILAILSSLLNFMYNDRNFHPGFIGYISIIFLGTVLRASWIEGDNLSRKAAPFVVSFIFIMIAFVGAFGYGPGRMPVRPVADLLGTYLGIMLFIGALAFSYMFCGSISTWLGKISYSLYLLHTIAILLMVVIAREIESVLGQVALIALALPISLLLAHFNFKWVEKPMIRLGQRLSRHEG